MDFKSIKESKEYQELLAAIPEAERAKVEEAVEKLANDFYERVIAPINRVTSK